MPYRSTIFGGLRMDQLSTGYEMFVKNDSGCLPIGVSG